MEGREGDRATLRLLITCYIVGSCVAIGLHGRGNVCMRECVCVCVCLCVYACACVFILQLAHGNEQAIKISICGIPSVLHRVIVQ